MFNIRLLVVLSLILSAASAVAQTAPPSPAAAPAAAAAPAPSAAAAPAPAACVKPARYPGAKASDVRKTAWHNEVKAWGECVKNYVADLRAQIDTRIKAANSTIEDYNAALKELQAQQTEAETGEAAPGNTKPK